MKRSMSNVAREYPCTGKAVAPMMTNLTLCSFNNVSSSSTSMSLAQGRHLAALLEHHVKPLLRRQRRQIVQFKLDFRTLVMRACLPNRHGPHLAREHDLTATHQIHSIALPPPEQVPCPEPQEGWLGECERREQKGLRTEVRSLCYSCRRAMPDGGFAPSM